MPSARAILAVDHNHRNLELLIQFLGRQGYCALGATSVDEFDQALDQPEPIALALVDIAGFDCEIWRRCDRLRGAGIPFLVISPRILAAVHERGLAHGARAVLVKPLGTKELAVLIRGLVEA